MTPLPPEEPRISPARKWAITFTVMVVAFMQILDTSVANVILPHLQGSLSAGLDEASWVITSYLAANAVVIPATGWLVGLFGRKRLFMVCASLFMVSSFVSGAAPDLTTLIVARVFQGLGGGPIIPLSQAILWEIFPFEQRGLAMAVWGMGFILGPILGPTVGGYMADEWSWRWIFYINLPIGMLGFLMASAFLFDPPYLRKVVRIDWCGLALMIVGFACLQLVLDRGEREDWFESSAIVAMTIVAVLSLVAFLIRELTAHDPILDLTVFRDRNFATGASLSALVGFGMYSGMLLVAVFTQKLLGYDAWTAGLVLAPGGLGNVFSLFASAMVTRVDQRLMLAFGCLLNAVSLYMMTSLTLGMDYWSLAWPRFIQGFAVGFIFVPMSTLTLATIRRDKLVNATAVYGMLRNVGGSVGIAVVTTLLAQRSQYHQATLVSHVNLWDAQTQERLTHWTAYFTTLGSDAFTAQRQAVGMIYRQTVTQAQLLAYTDDFWLLATMFALVPLVLPLMRRIRLEPKPPPSAPAPSGPPPPSSRKADDASAPEPRQFPRTEDMDMTARAFEEKDVTLSNGLKLHYYEWPGPEPALVLLHPSSGYGRMWEWTAAELGSRFHVYALDQRGHGDSGRPDGDYSAEEYANDLFLFFREVGIDWAIIAGQSLGGRVGQVFAATWPRQTLAVGLVGGPHPSNFFPTREATIGVLGAAQRMLDSKTEFPSREAALEALRTTRPRDREEARRHRVEHNMVELAGGGVAFKYDKVRVAIGLAHMADDLRKYAARTTCPVAILRGTASSEVTADQAREIAACWKDGSVVEIEGDYALQMENPFGLAKALVSLADKAE